MIPNTLLRGNLILIICFCLSIIASAQPLQSTRLLDEPLSEQVRLADSLNSKLDIAPGEGDKMYNEAERWASAQHDNKLLLTFKIIHAGYALTSTRDTAEQKRLEQKYLLLTNEFNSDDYLPLKLYSLNFLAEYYWSVRKDFKQAIELELKNYALYKGLSYKECPLRLKFLYQFSSKYYGFHDYEHSKNLMLEITDGAERDNPNPGPEIYYNLVGLCYRNLAMYDSAEYYFKIGLQKAEMKHNKIYHAILEGNIGIIYYYQQRYDEAIPLLMQDINYCLLKNEAPENAVKSMAILADLYLKKGDIVKASSVVKHANEVISAQKFWTYYDILEFVYPVTAEVAARQGDYTTAYRFMDSAFKIHQFNEKQKNALMLAGAQNVVAAQLHLAEIDRLKEQKKLQVLLRNGLIVVVLLLGALGLIIINYQRVQNKRKQEKLQAEKQLVAVELSNAAEQLQLFTRSIQEKNVLIEEFSTQLESLQPASVGMPTKYEPETLLRLRESTILTDEEWENFRKLFEKVHGGYLETLRMKIPGLSPAETRFVALTKLQLSNKEMAGMLGISTDAVRMNKHRLRKKLNLSEDISIEELVQSL
jgi:DNA-binding CsgD family transcriptional regulator